MKCCLCWKQTKNKIIELSRDHKPNLRSEKERIEAHGGEVARVNWADYGPFRVWKKGETFPGLAMSRSIGDDCAHSLGVSNQAEILEVDINKSDINFD